MRRIIGVFILLGFFAASCSSDINQEEQFLQKIAFSAEGLVQTNKSILVDGVKVYWEKDDLISVSGADDPFSTNLETASPKAVFEGNVEQAPYYYAAYPYSAVVEWAEELITLNLPNVQKAVKGTFASDLNITVASSTDEDRHFQFHNLLGYVKLTIGPSSGEITSVMIESNAGEPLSGEFYADCSEDKPEALADNDAYSNVILTSDSALQEGDYYIAMIPGTYSEGLKFVFEGPAGTAVKNAQKLLTLDAGHINSVGTISGLEWDTQDVFYSKVQDSYQDWSGEYLITYSTASTIKVFNSWGDEDEYKGYSRVDLFSKLTESGIPAEDGDPYKAVFTQVGDYYSINITGVGYIGCKSSNNNKLSKTLSQPSSANEEYLWNVTYDNGIRLKNAEYTSRRLQWNNSANIFRCYTGNQKEVTLYRREVSSNGSIPTPDPDPDPEDPDPEPEDPEDTTDPDQPGGDEGDIPTPIPGQSGKYGWYELPAISYYSSGSYLVDSEDSNLYYAHHHCAGNETGPGGRKARNYTVCFSAKHHCPVWVAAPRHKMYESGAERTDAYKRDPSIPGDIQYSSKSTGGGCNKGHMLGSAERLSSDATNRQVFYYSNIAPQYSSTFNTGGGGWNILEDWVDTKVCSDTLYVVIGAYFDRYTDKRGNSASPKTISFGGRTDVSCPTMFYYALLRTKKGNTGKPLSQCSSSEIMCVAMVRSHMTEKGTIVGQKDMMSISDLEKITGFNYFPNVPQAPKNTYTASEWGL